MKRVLVGSIVFAVLLVAGHVTLGFSRPLAFFILEHNGDMFAGRVDRYLLRRCSDHFRWNKSSLVYIGGEAAVDVDDLSNRIFIGEKEWRYSPRSVTEYVVISGGAVHPYERNPDAGVVVIFTPERIAFVDFTRKEAGCFRRVDSSKRGPRPNG